MKLVVAVVHGRDKTVVADQLIDAGFKFTIVGSTGGFLREGNSTFMVGTEDENLEVLKDIFCRCGKKRDQVISVAPIDGLGTGFIASAEHVRVGGGILFVLPIEDTLTF